jgi:hypothetical protein
MNSFELIMLIIITVGVFYYFLVAASVKKQRTRVIDLLVIGLLLYVSPYLENWLPEQLALNSTQIAGLLIFIYGWLIVIREKFREGLHDD